MKIKDVKLPDDFRTLVISISDKAFSNTYVDEGGMIMQRNLNDFFSKNSIRYSIEYLLISDDPSALRTILLKFKNDFGLIVISGGDGLSSGSYTPEVVKPMINKEIPGIMELIRMKLYPDFPSIVLSRSFAGLVGQCLVYAIPGDPSLIDPFLQEIFISLPSALHQIYND
jgi:molybdopterin adenylyltransferase